MTPYQQLLTQLPQNRRTWLVTGCAGFIGSHLIEKLLLLEQTVIGMDNFAGGHRRNLEMVEKSVGKQAWENFSFFEGDIRNFQDCQKAFGLGSIQHLLHQAALGSVPRSIEDPQTTHDVNVTGTVNVFLAARDAGVKSIVYASSSSVYGDDPHLPKKEGIIGRALSPYAVSKRTNELYADVFARNYGMTITGLRYFNVFGPRQDPQGAYAAVIPKWIHALQHGVQTVIYGDGSTTRDFCFVANVVQANLLAAIVRDSSQGQTGSHEVFNVGLGGTTNLLELHQLICSSLAEGSPDLPLNKPQFLPAREGDILHSQADIAALNSRLGFSPEVSLAEGIRRTVIG